MKLKLHRTGLIVGLFMVFVHALWSILVYLGLAKTYIDWILGLHFLSNPYKVAPFSFAKAGTLLIVVFVVGYIMGWVFAFIGNRLHKGR